jgi:hypothetical protein
MSIAKLSEAIRLKHLAFAVVSRCFFDDPPIDAHDNCRVRLLMAAFAK